MLDKRLDITHTYVVSIVVSVVNGKGLNSKKLTGKGDRFILFLFLLKSIEKCLTIIPNQSDVRQHLFMHHSQLVIIWTRMRICQLASHCTAL